MLATTVQKIAAFLRLGRMPPSLRSQLEAEGRILYLAEGIAETAVFRDFRAPGAYCSYRCIAFVGFFALSQQRLVVKARFADQISINIPYEDPRFHQLMFTATPRKLSVAFDASLQGPEMSGQLEVRAHLPDVATVAAILQRVGAQVKLVEQRCESGRRED